MSSNNRLQDIPVQTEMAASLPTPGQGLHWWRRAVQALTILLIILIPVSGLFRIDPMAGAFIVLDRQVWFADFHIIVGLWLMLSCILVATYSMIGMAFCGWSCPQNTMVEWANRMTTKWLGKRAALNVDGSEMQTSMGKDKWLNWLVLGAMFTAVSMLAALVPLLFFYSPDIVWSFIIFRDDERLASSLYWIYSIFVLIWLLNIAFIRHFWCRFMCIYRVWQHSFKTRETLRIVHDAAQADECASCNFCVTSCIADIDPRQTDIYDSCINCGECINACNQVRAGRKSGSSLLRFELGHQEDGERIRAGKNVGSVRGRIPVLLSIASLGLGLFVWGVSNYQSHHFSVYRSDTMQGDKLVDYRIYVANKLYSPARYTFTVEGLPEGSYQLSAATLALGDVERGDLNLRLSESLPKGLYRFLVKIRADDGWQGSFRVHHLSLGEDT